MDEFNESSVFDPLDPFFSPLPSPPPLIPLVPPPTRIASDAPTLLDLPPIALYPSRDTLFEAIQSWSKPRGYAFTIGKSKKMPDGRQKVYYACDRCPPVRRPKRDGIRGTQSRGTGCPFSIIAFQSLTLEWEVRYRSADFSTHNHPPSQNPAAHPSHRHLSIQAQNTAQTLFLAGIQPRQSLTYLRNMAPETPLLPRDLYNFNASLRRDLRQGHSPTEALIQHLQDDGIRHCILQDHESLRLKGLFIACPESVHYLQNHHDVVLIDNTYSTNRFHMPLMDVIGKLSSRLLNPLI
jgi:hypothetical protein